MSFKHALISFMVTTGLVGQVSALDLELKKQVYAGQTAFGLKTLQAVLAAESEEKNIFFSPVSLNLALNLLHAGAEGHTRQDMDQVFQLPRLTQTQFNLINHDYLTMAQENIDGLEIKFANALWANSELPLQPAYVQNMQDFYNATIDNVDFQGNAAAAAEQINTWAAQNTNGKIQKVIDAPTASTLDMLLANATYFKGIWKHEFIKEHTRKGDFTLSNGQTVQVDKMHSFSKLRYLEKAGAQVVELPFQGDSASMLVILPPQGVAAKQWMIDNALSATFLEQVNAQLESKETVLRLPKFKFQYSKGLTDELKLLGLADLFARPDLSGISPVGLSVSYVKQDTFVQVDEKGAEAAAVTTIGITRTSVNPNPPKIVDINRPFLVVIQEKKLNSLLFMGAIAKPVWE